MVRHVRSPYGIRMGDYDRSDVEILTDLGISTESSLLSENFKRRRRQRNKESISLIAPPVERIDEGEILL